jgi:hypothetical protein
MGLEFNEKFSAYEDLSSYQYYVVVNSSTSTTDRGIARSATAGEPTCGVVITKTASLESASVTMFGPAKVRAGGTIVGGGDFTTTASGTATATASGDYTLGRAVTSAASGNIFDAIILHQGYVS